MDNNDNNGYHVDQNDDRGDGDFKVARNDVVDAGDIALTTLERSHVRTSANVSIMLSWYNRDSNCPPPWNDVIMIQPPGGAKDSIVIRQYLRVLINCNQNEFDVN